MNTFFAIRLCFMLEKEWNVMARVEPAHPIYRNYVEVVRAAVEDTRKQWHKVEIRDIIRVIA